MVFYHMSVTFDNYLPIHTSTFLDLITDKFIVVSSSYQKWVSSLALFSNEAGVEQIRFNLGAWEYGMLRLQPLGWQDVW